MASCCSHCVPYLFFLLVIFYFTECNCTALTVQMAKLWGLVEHQLLSLFQQYVSHLSQLLISSKMLPES